MLRSKVNKMLTLENLHTKETLPEWAVHREMRTIKWLSSLSPKVLALATKLMNLGNLFTRTYPSECLNRIPRVISVHGKRPIILDNCFVAPSALISGDVHLGRKNYIGYNAILRAEENESIILGESCNVQEKAVITGNSTIGKWSTIEPMAIVDSANIAACSFVGANSILLRNSRIESNSMLCACSVLQSGAIIPSGEMWSGNPAEKVCDLSEREKEEIIKAAKHMVLLAVQHHDSWELTWEDIDNQRMAREKIAERNRDAVPIRLKGAYIKEPPRPTQKQAARYSPMEIIHGTEGKPPLQNIDNSDFYV